MNRAERKVVIQQERAKVLKALETRPMSGAELSEVTGLLSGRVYIHLQWLRTHRTLKRHPVRTENGLTVGRYELKAERVK